MYISFTHLSLVDPKIPMIQTPQDFEKYCVNTEIACILTILAPNEDEPLQESLDLLSTLKKKHENSFAFAYLDASLETRSPFIDIMTGKYGVGDMFPSIFCLNLKREWTSNFRGAFDAEGVERWVEEMQRGKGRSKIDKGVAIMEPLKKKEEKKAEKKEKVGHDEL
jgi:hypothetical protein